MSEATVRTSRDDDVVVVAVEGEIDFSNVSRVGEDIMAALAPDAVGLVLDARAVRYLDSSGVSMIFALLRRLQTARRGLAVAVGAESFLVRLFRITLLDAYVPVRSDVASCVEDVRRAAEVI